MKKSKKKKKPTRDFHYDPESFPIDDVLSQIKKERKEKKKRIGLTC